MGIICTITQKYISTTKISFGELYIKTLDIEKYVYKIVSIWENDFNENS